MKKEHMQIGNQVVQQGSSTLPGHCTKSFKWAALLFDQSVDKATRKRRPHRLKKLGNFFIDCPESVLGGRK